MNNSYQKFVAALPGAFFLDAFILLLIFLYARTFWQKRFWSHTTGTVVEVGPSEYESQPGVITYEFTVGGRKYRKGPIGSAGKLGQELAVVYPNNNPESAELYQPGTLIAFIVMCLIFAIPANYYAYLYICDYIGNSFCIIE